MNIENLPDGFKLALAKDEVYTYDRRNKKWMLGKKDAPKDRISMLEFIVKQLEEPEAERVEDVEVDVKGKTVKKDDPAEVVKNTKSLPRITSIPDKPEGEAGAKPADILEEKKKLIKEIRQELDQRDAIKSEDKPTNIGPTSKRIPINVKIANVAEIAKAIVEAMSGQGGVRGTVYGGGTFSTSPRGPAGRRPDDVLKSNRPMPKDFEPKFGGRQSLDKLADLSEGEKELLQRRGVAPSSDRDFSYRKDGKPLSKQEILEELDQSYNESPLKKNFKSRLREKLPYARFFTNALEDPEDIAKGNAPRQQVSGAIKSFKQTKLYDKVSQSGPFKKMMDTKEALTRPGTVYGDVRAKGSETAEKIKSFFRPKTTASVVQNGAEAGIKSRGAKAAAEMVEGTGLLAAKEVGAKTATREAEKLAIKQAEKAAAKGVGKSIFKKIPGVSLLAGLAFGAGRLMKGDLLGAAGEVASGAASTVLPGYGTLASAGIDAALAARDMSSQGDAEKVSVNAKGNVFNKIQMFKDGGVVDSPTAFTHSGGTGIMGEAGPEAIVPLQRTADGKLGIEQVSKTPISSQTQQLKEADTELKKKSNQTQQSETPTIINNNVTTNNMKGGDGGGMSRSQTAAPRGSLATNYFAY